MDHGNLSAQTNYPVKLKYGSRPSTLHNLRHETVNVADHMAFERAPEPHTKSTRSQRTLAQWTRTNMQGGQDFTNWTVSMNEIWSSNCGCLTLSVVGLQDHAAETQDIVTKRVCVWLVWLSEWVSVGDQVGWVLIGKARIGFNSWKVDSRVHCESIAMEIECWKK